MIRKMLMTMAVLVIASGLVLSVAAQEQKTEPDQKTAKSDPMMGKKMMGQEMMGEQSAENDTSMVMNPEVLEKIKESKEKYTYVGAKACMPCHFKEYKSWQQTPMAKAYSLLNEEQQKDSACYICHITAVQPDGTVLENVQCEACHGPGSAYKNINIMKDKQKALANGMWEPTKTVCLQCHQKDGNPFFKPFTYSTTNGIHEHFPLKNE